MTVELILAVIVGLVLGVLGTLWYDTQKLVQQVQEANVEKQKSFATLQKFQIRHKATEQQLGLAQTELVTALDERNHLEQTIARQLAEIEAGREQLQLTIKTNENLKENLEETQERLEETEGLRLLAEEKLETAVAENGRLLGEIQLVESEIATLEGKIKNLMQALGQSQTRTADLEQKALAAEAQVATLEAERDSAQVQLEQAELVSAELKAQIATLHQEVEEASAVQQQLSATKEKLQAANAHVQKLQNTMEDVQTKMNYSGKSELQLISGIGPTYARRLSEFGIHSFADLADCSPDQVASIIKKKKWQAVNIQDWLDEAKALAATLDGNEQ